ncbi:hypothetical protein [Clostridium scatologenes]|uniref:SbsA Ig-like domain-containing protein n=1 Tax=Clostridium scatologenes TaxID=1548 RepID=A0A0E3K1M8_CLOSL|nr:hypothetical protein [Clostridium scatologenes]AKA70133.1 hypothetical protein CSCA_3008 [Clostridium scatologenes]
MEEGKALVNIVRTEIINERTLEKFSFVTQSSCDIKPDLSAGKEDILRVKDTIYGINQTEDITIGYEVKMTDSLLTPELMALVDGGTFVSGKYEAPKAGIKVNRDKYTLSIYTEEKDYTDTVGYAKFTTKHNKGKALDFKLKDGAFYVPEFNSKSRPARGESPIEIEFLDTLPNDTPIVPPSTGGATVPTPPTPTTADGTTKTPGVTIGSDCRVTWVFATAINDADATVTNFKVTKKTVGTVVAGNVTIDSTKKIVTFVPTSIAAGITYTATALAVRSSGATTADTTSVSVDFTTV